MAARSGALAAVPSPCHRGAIAAGGSGCRARGGAGGGGARLSAGAAEGGALPGLGAAGLGLRARCGAGAPGPLTRTGKPQLRGALGAVAPPGQRHGARCRLEDGAARFRPAPHAQSVFGVFSCRRLWDLVISDSQVVCTYSGYAALLLPAGFPLKCLRAVARD